ncbi:MULTISPECIES: RNA polymerase sigma factor [Sphingobium]|uniref:DNA-directed RNA polymerase sigma-70 factor n=2 Tax=Sphingobium fuliginis (strain ATCC 27551) TaxID=336203 RepID=A0A292ZDY7_SPHSA|nr:MULTISPECIES: sigma-70 family RNA polymerase sigma factor [Sphingobium]AJR25751.1 FecI sigma-24 factor [Sphingobium sp. YBL2]MCB4861825.1 sigma-70 family RNA polymerase sigma factor [Sphingobium sp. PNB]PNQ04678.1 RNA polymerase subunit sigma-24 [Sphingobium sp. SA916]UXC92394.1 sigma-70 family RNA polymerase sigma factor [Sphingobium sp. RSMS]WDA37930.1 sigma-70 family RNA polymerase sigma factor [Sphingobium sp. YC-XJ3]
MSPSLTERGDAELAALALAGQQSAYGELMRRHRDAVFRLARGHAGDATEALDITQETFISAFAALGRYDGARPFRLWIARIAVNKCRDWARRRAVRRFFTFARPIEEAGAVADGMPTPEEAVQSRAELAHIHAAIAALPGNLKDVLVLRAIEGMSQAEAAQILGISEKAVETRLYRARNKLAEGLRDGATGRV